MPQWLDIDGNHKLDWFFNAYVYGTEVPKYTVTSELRRMGGDDRPFQSDAGGVSDNFTMLVPLYIELRTRR